MLGEMLVRVRETAPLIHNITNYVTVNDVANMLLACGASPIMADDPDEAAEITALCAGLCINLGTLSRSRLSAMLAAGKTANALGLPVVLDPVGAGASALRTDAARRLLSELRLAAIRCNMSELRALALGSGHTKGVDADALERVTEENLSPTVDFVKGFARATGAVIAVTGSIDVISDGDTAWCVRNGHPIMGRITGAGCQLSALTAAFLAANPGTSLTAAAAAVCAMGLAGEIAHARMTPADGNASCRNYIIDAMYNLTPEALERGAKYETR